MMTVFLDESGYTGQDLLNKEQPFFVLASLSLPEQDCVDLKNEFFQKVQARELKHSALARYKAYQQFVLQFLRDIKQQQQYFKVSVTHKHFALVCKLVDFVMEPVLYEHGINLYDRGMNIATANLFFTTMPVFGGQDFFNDLLARFQSMMRLRTSDAFQNFFDLVLQEQTSEHLEQQLNMLRPAYHQLGPRFVEALPANTLDVAFAQAMVIMSEWRRQLADPIEVIHDESSNMSKQKDIWDALTSPNIPAATVGYDRRKWSYPIGVSKTTFDRSENWAGLQLADVVAGAFARAAMYAYVDQAQGDEYGRELLRVVEGFPITPLLPGSEVTPEELGTIGTNADEPNEHLAKIIYDRLRNADQEEEK